MHQVLADAVLVVHVAFVVFVVALLPLILVGGRRQWAWVRNVWVRVAHLAGIGVVAAQAWAGVVCPLTTLEMWLRREADQHAYGGSFVEYWLQRLLYFDAPAWVFTAAYSLFGLVVLGTLVLVPPRRAKGTRAASAAGTRRRDGNPGPTPPGAPAHVAPEAERDA